MNNLTSEVIRAARALLRWEQRNLAESLDLASDNRSCVE